MAVLLQGCAGECRIKVPFPKRNVRRSAETGRVGRNAIVKRTKLFNFPFYRRIAQQLY